MKVEINNRAFADGRYTNRAGQVWSVTRLAAHAKELPVFDLPLVAIDISVAPFGSERNSVRQMAEHAKRVMEADLSFPVMMDPDGWIMDGWHRIIRALVEGWTTVKAVRFEVMPQHEFTEDTE